MPAVKRYWETGKVIFTSTTVPVLVVKLNGGESVTIKMTATGTESVYLGPDRYLTTNKSYKMDNGETVSMGLSERFGKDALIEIWALPQSTSDTLHYMKIIGPAADTEAT